MAVPRDNMFGLFAGAPGVGGRQERRRQFALGPSQIANLPGNFPMPRPPDAGPPGAGFAAQQIVAPKGGPGIGATNAPRPADPPPRLLLTGEMDAPANAPQRPKSRQAQAQAAQARGARAEDVRFVDERLANLPAAEPFPALVKAPRAASPRGVLRGPGTPPEDAERLAFAPPGLANRRPGSGRSQRPGSRGTPPGMRPSSGEGSARELEARLAVAESQAAAQAARVRNLERRLAVAEAARKEDDSGARGSTEALERRVDALTQMYARSESVSAEMRGRLEAAESEARESRAQATRAESVAQNLVVGARDNMEQIGNRISVEQSSDAKRLDTLSAEIARLTREVADARGDDLSKRQLMEADIARLSGQKSSENSMAQIGDVRAKLNATEELARSLAEQLAIEKAGRAESETRFEGIVARLEETSSAREQALMRKFEHELADRVTELQRKVVDESEEAALRDQDIIREKDDQMASFEQGTKRERQKTVEHQMVLEKAIREEHEARVAQAATLTKQLDRVNHDVVALVEDERLARETKESKLRGQITQTLAKLHDANRETNERLESEAHAVRSVLKTEIEARVVAMDAVHKGLERGTTGMERQLAAGRVEAAQAVRTAEVKLSRRLAATEGRVEVEVAALRKLYARQTALELDLDAFKRDVVGAFEQMQEEVTVAAVAQALNTETDNVQAEYVTDAVQSLVDKIAAQDARDRAAAEALERAVFGPTPAGEPGLVPRADRAERRLGEAFDALSVFERELGVARETATEDKAELESQVALLQQEVDSNAAATLVETETLQTQVDIAMGEVAGAGEMIEGKLRVTAEDLAQRNVKRMEEIRTELWVPLSSLRAAIDAEAAARAKTDEDVATHARARDEAVGALWAAVEAHYAAQTLDVETARLDCEEFAVARVGAFEDALDLEQRKRAEALEKLKQHVVAAVEEEAERRRRGDDETRRAYEDDVANLEDTAAEAVRELREGLRDEVAERAHQAETLHRDLSSTLDSARSRLERDVRALEETAAGNIATQKLEEEMLRAEVDDGLAQMHDAVEEMREEVGRHCETIAAAAGGAAEPVTRRVEALETSLAGAARADEVEKAFRQVHADVAEVEAEVAGAAAARLAENEAYRAEFEQSVFAEATARERSMREMASRFDADVEDAKQEAGVDVAVAAEALRADLEAQVRESAAVCAGALDEEAAERKAGDASVGGKIATAVGVVADELRRSVLELAADLTTESETLRAHCEAHAAQAVAALQSTVTEGLGLNAEALEELRGDVAAAVEKVEGMEGGGGGGGGGEEDAKSVHSDISEAKEKLGEMQREIEAVKAHAEQQVAELLAKSQEDLKAEMSKGNEATAAMLEKIMAKLAAE